MPFPTMDFFKRHQSSQSSSANDGLPVTLYYDPDPQYWVPSSARETVRRFCDTDWSELANAVTSDMSEVEQAIVHILSGDRRSGRPAQVVDQVRALQKLGVLDDEQARTVLDVCVSDVQDIDHLHTDIATLGEAIRGSKMYSSRLETAANTLKNAVQLSEMASEVISDYIAASKASKGSKGSWFKSKTQSTKGDPPELEDARKLLQANLTEWQEKGRKWRVSDESQVQLGTVKGEHERSEDQVKSLCLWNHLPGGRYADLRTQTGGSS